MKKQSHSWHNYIPLLITGLTVIGSITVGVLTIIANTKPLERDIAWLKENTSEMKDEIVKLKHGISQSDEGISEVFMEILDRLEGYKKVKKGDK